MEPYDPFSFITKRCQISPSQEELLRHSGSVALPEVQEDQSDDSQLPEYFEYELTGIMFVTPPVSPEYNVENDNSIPKDKESFQTLPENSQIARSDDRRDDQRIVVEEDGETGGGVTEGDKTVDLGADTDFVFSEAEFALRSGNIDEVIQSQLNKVSALKRELAKREFLIESLTRKKSKISDINFCSESLKPFVVETVDKISMEKFMSTEDIPSKCGDKSHQSNQDAEASGDNSAKRKLDFSTENVGFETEASDMGLGLGEDSELSKRNKDGGRSASINGDGEGPSSLGQKSIKDIDKNVYSGPSVDNPSEMGRKPREKRALPASLCQKGEKDSGNDSKKVTVWDVLKMLAKHCEYDRSLDTKSILEVAKSRGMTFP